MRFRIHRGDPDYPESLKKVEQPPKTIWGSGDVSLLSTGKRIAIVGAREATPYGLKIARELAEFLGRHGVTVVSGHAYGVDTAAHEGVMAVGGKTIAVLGCGLDSPYLQQNWDLRKEMAKKGVVISEFSPDADATPWNFPKRNRLISGLSSAVIVVEANIKSGSLITADWALKQGKEVFAVPGNITSPLSAGPNRLIRDGATPILSAEGLLENLEIPFLVETIQTKKRSGPPTQEEKILELLSYGEHSIDEVVESTGLEAQQVSALLVSLEIHGKVKASPGGNFRIHG